MNVIKIPYALGVDGRLVSCEIAPREGAYSCPGCKEQVILKRGVRNRAHFAHAPDSLCAGESILHLLAKGLVQQTLRDAAAGGVSPTFDFACEVCRTTRIACAIPVFDRADVEVVYEHLDLDEPTSKRVLDVGLIRADQVIAGIEILATHRVDENKADDLLLIPWLELRAKDVLDDPLHWKPVQESWVADHHERTCKSCQHRTTGFYTARKSIAEMTGQPILDYWFRTAPHSCWSCHRSMLVYAWRSEFEYAMHEAKIAKERAPTVDYRFVKTQQQKTWTNYCPHCDATQGEHFLHHEPEGPFFGVELLMDDDEHWDYVNMAYIIESMTGTEFSRA